MELGLREKYTIGIEVVFLALILLITVVVKVSYFIAVKRQWTRCKGAYDRFILPVHYLLCFCILSAMIFVGSALDFYSSYISLFGVWVLLSLGWINYNRLPCYEQDEFLNYDMEDISYMIPMTPYASIEYQQQYLVARGQMYNSKKEIRGVRSYAKSLSNGVCRNKRQIIGGILLSLVCSIITWLLTDGMCIAAHPVQVSTWFTRQFEPDVCAPNAVCNVYFTLTEDPTTSVIVNFHSRDTPKNGFVDYRLLGETRVYQAEANWFKFEELKEVNRHIYWAEITGLQPGQVYEIIPGYKDHAGKFVYSVEEFKIRTVPAHGNVTFVNGGDMQNDENGDTMSKVAASHDPLFALFGGDIAYANSNLHCYKRWDFWFSNWNKYMKTSEGLSVPISVTIGNHEAGGDRGRTRDDLAFYLEYFPQQLGLKDVPPKQRPLYHSHQISNHTLALMLDSGLVESFIGPQSIWMEEQLNKTTSVNKIATYHYPLYPAVTVAKFMTPEEKQTWVGLFERYNLTVGFENHFHVFKESKPIRNNQVDEKDGIPYFGDGAWGIDGGPTFLNPDSWWIKSAVQKAHVYVVTASETSFDVKAYDVNNEQLTSYTKSHV